MAIIAMIVSIAVLGILYKRMIDREVPDKIGTAQALVPVGLGIVSLPLSLPIVLGVAVLLTQAGYVKDGYPMWVRSLVAAFATAGFPEELSKFLMILVSLIIFRKRIRNVYEYALIGAAVGAGFTVFEEYLYGDANLLNFLFRLLTIGLHMLFSLIMAYYLGKAKYQKKTGEGSPFVSRLLAFLIPVALHTVYDACTGLNGLLSAENDDAILTGIIVGIGSTIVMFIVQILLLRRFKKDAEELSGMSLVQDEGLIG